MLFAEEDSECNGPDMDDTRDDPDFLEAEQLDAIIASGACDVTGTTVVHASCCPLVTRRCTNDTTHPTCRTSFHLSKQPSLCLFAETEPSTTTSDVEESPASSDAQQSVITEVPAAGSSASHHTNGAVACKTYPCR